jgi:hypothetical protein
MSYADKLRDPRWQKRRLEIMERDGWTCLGCGDKTNTLTVHHLVYTGEPWDAPANHLETLCEECHGWREDFNKLAGRSVIPTRAILGILSFNQMIGKRPDRVINPDRIGMELHFWMCCRMAHERNITTEVASAIIRNLPQNGEKPLDVIRREHE